MTNIPAINYNPAAALSPYEPVGSPPQTSFGDSGPVPTQADLIQLGQQARNGDMQATLALHAKLSQAPMETQQAWQKYFEKQGQQASPFGQPLSQPPTDQFNRGGGQLMPAGYPNQMPPNGMFDLASLSGAPGMMPGGPPPGAPVGMPAGMPMGPGYPDPQQMYGPQMNPGAPMGMPPGVMMDPSAIPQQQPGFPPQDPTAALNSAEQKTGFWGTAGKWATRILAAIGVIQLYNWTFNRGSKEDAATLDNNSALVDGNGKPETTTPAEPEPEKKDA